MTLDIFTPTYANVLPVICDTSTYCVLVSNASDHIFHSEHDGDVAALSSHFFQMWWQSPSDEDREIGPSCALGALSAVALKDDGRTFVFDSTRKDRAHFRPVVHD